VRTIKETLVPPTDYRYPFLEEEKTDGSAAKEAVKEKARMN
jgi:hypothetical protein